MNLSCNKPVTSGAGETLTITCFTCGMPSSKEWAQKVRSRPSSTHLKSYYPFLLQIHTSPGAALKEDGSTFVCAFCHASMEAQWKNYERQPTGIPPMNRKYNLYKFICAVCGVETYRKRVRTLPFQEFPFLTNQRPAGSLTLGNNPLAIVCLDCSETLWAQSAEYDRWGLPVHKRMFNWMARPPPPEDSVEATVARLPSGETQLPRCPPTEPVIVPKQKEPHPFAYDAILATKKTTTKARNSMSESSSSGNEPIIVRKSSLTSTTYPILETGVHSQSQPPVVTVAPMSAHTTTLSSLRKESLSVPPNMNSSVFSKYDAIAVPGSLQPVAHPHSHPHPGSYFPRSPLFTSTYGHQGHSFPWGGDGVGREGNGSSSLGEHYVRYSTSATAATVDTLQSGNPTWAWVPPPPPSSNLLPYPNFMPPSFPSRSFNEQFYGTSHSFHPPSPESNSNSNSNLPISVVVSSTTGSSTIYSGPFGIRTSSYGGGSGRSSSPISAHPPSGSTSTINSQTLSLSNSSIQCQIQCPKVNVSTSGTGGGQKQQACSNSDDPELLPVSISARKSLSVSTSSSDYNNRRFRSIHEVDVGSQQQSTFSCSSHSGKRKAVGDGRKISHKIIAHPENTDDLSVISYRGTAMPKKLFSSKVSRSQNVVGEAENDITESTYVEINSVSCKESSGSGIILQGSDTLPTNFKPKSHAIRNHMNEKEKFLNQNQCQNLNAMGNQLTAAVATVEGESFTSEQTPTATSVTLTTPLPKKWQWQSQYLNKGRTAVTLAMTATSATIGSTNGVGSGSSSSSNSNSSGDGNRRSRNASESEPMDFSIVSRTSGSHEDNKSTVVIKKSSDDDHESPDGVMDLSLSSTSHHRGVHPYYHHNHQQSTSINSNNNGRSLEPMAHNVSSSRKFMIAYLCQSDTSSDTPSHGQEQGYVDGQSTTIKEPEIVQEDTELMQRCIEDFYENTNANNTDNDETQSRQSSRSNSSEPSGRRSVIVTTTSPSPKNAAVLASVSHSALEPKLKLIRKKRRNQNMCQRQRQRQRREERMASQEDKVQGRNSLNSEVEDEDVDVSDSYESETSRRLDLDIHEDGDGDDDDDSPEKASSTFRLKNKIPEKRRKSTTEENQNLVEHDMEDKSGKNSLDVVELNVDENENNVSENEHINSEDADTVESDAHPNNCHKKTMNLKAVMDYKRAQEYAKKVIGEYKLEERQTRILKRKLEMDQEEFLGSLGLITLQKKSELELNVLIQRSNHYTLPPLKFRPSTPPKVQLSEEFEKKLLQIAFDDPSLNKKSDLSSDEVTFLAQLDLKPASIPEKNKREKEWRIILTERMMREKRGSFLRGAKKPWDSYCGASKLLTPTIKSPCDNSSDYFGSLSLTLPTEKNDFAFSNPNRTNGSSDLLTIVDSFNNNSGPNEDTVTSSEGRRCSHYSNGNRSQTEPITVSAMCIMQPVISYPKYIPSYVTQVSVPSCSIRSCASTSDLVSEDRNSTSTPSTTTAAEVSPSDSGRTSSHSPRSRFDCGRGSPNEVLSMEEIPHTPLNPNSSSIPLSKILKVPVVNVSSSGALVPTTPMTLNLIPAAFAPSTQFQRENDKTKAEVVLDPRSQPEVEDMVAMNNVFITVKEEESSSADISNSDLNNTSCVSNSTQNQPLTVLDAIIDADVLSCAKFEKEIQNLINSFPPPPKSKTTVPPTSTDAKSEENCPSWPESVEEWKKLKKYLKTRQSQVKAIEDKLKKREKQILNQLRTCAKNTHQKLYN